MSKHVFFLFIIFMVFINNENISAQSDNAFLDLVQHQSFNYFWDEVYASVGLIADKGANRDGTGYTCPVSSIAVVGFGLTTICIAHSRGWIRYNDAYTRILTTLHTFQNSVQGKNGFFYHMVKVNNGTRDGNSEVSTIDSSLFIAGALFAGQYFKNTEIQTVADQLYRNMNWTWMCGSSDFVSMGWKPEIDVPGGYTIPYDGGYLCSSQWDSYDESPLLDILAIGSPTYQPINSPNCWKNMILRFGSYAGYNDILYADNWMNPLFLHQYPHVYIDFRRKTYTWPGRTVNFFDNSIKASLANKQYSQATWPSCCPGNIWGFTTCDAENGYINFGAPPWDFPAANDGTVAPTAAGASLQFTPSESIQCLRYIYDNYKDTVWGNDPNVRIWGRYGFADAFNICSNYCQPLVLGLDQGPMVLSIENYRSGMVWDIFMQIPYINDALNIIGFVDTGDNTRPATINDLKIENGNLTWTAPGDDNNVGNASSYEIRYLDRAINSYGDWFDAQIINNTIIPGVVGTKEQFPITFLGSGNYYFNIRAVDENGNKSILGNSTDIYNVNTKENKLIQSSNNPFNLNNGQPVTISYSIVEKGYVHLRLYSVTGIIVKEWDKGNQIPFTYTFDWNGLDQMNKKVNPGVYNLLLLLNGKRVDGKKIIVVR